MKVKVIKRKDRTNPAERRHALGLLKSLVLTGQTVRREIVIGIGEADYKITIDKVVTQTHNLA